MKTILVVAQNPKTELNITTPLIGTRSHHIFKGWLNESGISEEEIEYINAYPYIGKVKVSVVHDPANIQMIAKMILDRVVVISLGSVADKAVSKASEMNARLGYRVRIPSIIMNIPHPSGLNRKLNDKMVRDKIIRDLSSLQNILFTHK